jgi:hypothetical protein
MVTFILMLDGFNMLFPQGISMKMVFSGTTRVDCLLEGDSGFPHILEQEPLGKHSVRSPLENTRDGIPEGAYWGDSSPWRHFP